MLAIDQVKPVESNECVRSSAEMDFLIAQKMMYEIITVKWPQAYDGSEGQVYKNTYHMTLSDFLEHWLKELDKDSEDIVSIKPI